MARQARRGTVRLGLARLGESRHSKARQAWHGVVRQGTARRGKARQVIDGQYTILYHHAMKHYETVEIPARTEVRVARVTCDLCGNSIDKKTRNADDVVVKRVSGTLYPEGGHGKETSVDMCGSCFETKLVPWLRSLGAEPNMREWDV
jgi:hypothetical protein